MSQKGSTEASVIVCAHNEEKYVRKCLSSILNAVSKIDSEIVFVADRCTDNTVEMARKLGVTNVIEKKWKKMEKQLC
ncbi:MAG: glycosyltransferase family 2 protein [Candidatus Bathyarchaeota archaeon]|nr:glycosyltransferase family 2 protein [Candidatus Bathyarchaeota archaeon]MDH5746355.1 glycosyltransferase family 2 protein [Candidatus Bathyarchaeota archaeon]